MADSYTLHHPISSAAETPPRRKVLVTGAAGRIGSYFAQHSHNRYDLRLLVLDPHDEEVAALKDYGEVIAGDVTDLESIRTACQDVDTVLHLAGNPSPTATWHSVRDVNIEGTYHTMVAAKAAGCRRVVFASSIHAVAGYPPDRQVMTDDPVNPADLYGVSKCFGEAMGRYMAQQQGLSVIAVRICGFQPLDFARREDSAPMLDAFVSDRDLNQLLCRCVDDEKINFAIVHGLSDNQFKRLDLTRTRELLDYHPQDDLTKMNPRLKDLDLTPQDHNDQRKPGIREELDRLK